MGANSKPRTQVDWDKVDHYFARGADCFGRGLTLADAVKVARSYLARSMPKAERLAGAFDVWFVPAGATLFIDGMGTVRWDNNVSQVQARKGT